jgi:DNA-binding transcriptional ArsR family regulator
MLGRRRGTPSGHVPGGSTASANLSELVSKGLMVRAIVVAAKLKIADLIAEGARSADELAHATGVHAPSLYRLLRALRGLDLLVEDDAGRFSLGPLGDALRTGPASLREHAAFFGDMSLWDAWGRLEHSVRTGEPAFRHAHGVSRIDHLHPRAQADRGTSKLPAID